MNKYFLSLFSRHLPISFCYCRPPPHQSSLLLHHVNLSSIVFIPLFFHILAPYFLPSCLPFFLPLLFFPLTLFAFLMLFLPTHLILLSLFPHQTKPPLPYHSFPLLSSLHPILTHLFFSPTSPSFSLSQPPSTFPSRSGISQLTTCLTILTTQQTNSVSALIFRQS